jgi:uncharacterized coiled-coil DUF342 family protein
MRKIKTVLIAVLSLVLVLGLLAGCGGSTGTSGGVDSALLDEAKEQIANLQDEIEEWKDKAAEFQQRVQEVAAESELVGDTDEETAMNIVEQYHETHTYSKTDLFVCADMAMDVWNMLQAQGINAVIQIGDVEKAIVNMQDSSHAWVLAEVAPGQELALETTSGKAVERSENPLYYAGWSFTTPAKYKEFEQLKHEHNIRFELIDELNADGQEITNSYNTAVDVYNNLLNEFNTTYAGQVSSDESQAAYDELNNQKAVMKELEGRLNQINLLIAEQQAKLDKIPPKMQSLVQ